MKRFLLALLPLTAYGDLVITEVMSSSNHVSTTINGDWWELTNNGAVAIDLAGYGWDDDSNLVNAQTFPAYVMQPGESVVMLAEGTVASIAPFRAAWGIPASVKIFVESDFGSFPGFSGGNGDTIYVYFPNNAVATQFAFGSATGGSSFSSFDDGSSVPGGLSVDGVYGAGTSNQSPGDVGSPGSAASVPAPVPPTFVGSFVTAWPIGRDFADSDFRIRAEDANAGDVVSLTVGATASWMTVTALGGGVAQLSGTPPSGSAGIYQIVVEADDNTGTGTVAQVYTYEILPATSPVVLNEYNAVGPDLFLDGADEGEVGAPEDSFFRQIEGNGGAWVEFVVVGDGTGSPVDLRGVTIEITSDVNNGFTTPARVLKLSDHVALSAIPTGTILTFREEGVTELNRVSAFTNLGYAWSEISMFDPVLIDQSASSHPAVPSIGAENTKVTLKDAAGVIFYGSSGESIGAEDSDSNGIPDELISVSDVEVYKLEQNPVGTLDPLFGLYADGSSSTYGAPNKWSGGTQTQSFATFIKSNSPPVFGTVPGAYATAGSYNDGVSLIDPQGQAVTITALNLPSFLTLTDAGDGTATVVSNRLLTVADMGDYDITLVGDDGQASDNVTYYPFRLTVVHPEPSVVLNEFNAVSNSGFLNGGVIGLDSDGAPNARDSFFGRVAGNGNDWVEFAVVGDGGPSTVDMRGWTIQIGRAKVAGVFQAEADLVLTQAAEWSAVRAGTLLTFIKDSSAQGGRDSEFDIVDQIATQGWAWSNVHMGDVAMVEGLDLSMISIDSSDTQFRVIDADGVLIFGPSGENVPGLPVNVGGSEVFELEADPSPSVGIVDLASGTARPGYDDSSSGSTFGAPNMFTPANETIRAQDFSNYVVAPTSYASWASGFGLGGTTQNDDADSDGWSNEEEYLFGGVPTSGSSIPSAVITPSEGSVEWDVRVTDPAISGYTGERSGDLQSWLQSGFTTELVGSPLGGEYRRFKIIYVGNEPKQFFRVRPE